MLRSRQPGFLKGVRPFTVTGATKCDSKSKVGWMLKLSDLKMQRTEIGIGLWDDVRLDSAFKSDGMPCCACCEDECEDDW